MVTHLKIHNKSGKNAEEVFRGCGSFFLSEEFHRFTELAS